MTVLAQVYAFDRNKTREWPVPSGTPKGTAVIGVGDQPAVTITNRGDSTNTKTLAGGYSVTYPNAPVSVRTDSAIVAVDGSWAGPVTGATSATVRNTLVYYVVADGTLTLTAGSNIKFGVTDNYEGKASASLTTIKIGVFA